MVKLRSMRAKWWSMMQVFFSAPASDNDDDGDDDGDGDGDGDGGGSELVWGTHLWSRTRRTMTTKMWARTRDDGFCPQFIKITGGFVPSSHEFYLVYLERLQIQTNSI